MTRLEKLEAVAEAARELAHRVEQGLSVLDARCKVQAALAALDADAEAQTGETVTLAVWRSPRGQVAFDVAGTPNDRSGETEWTRLGTVTLPLNRERGA